MKKALIGVLTVGMLALVTGRAWAPIYSFFPGLSTLAERSEFIVVATILPQMPDPQTDIGGGAAQKIKILGVLKGDIKPGLETVAYLRNLSVRTGRVNRPTVLEKGYLWSERYVLFLVKNRDPKLAFEYRNENSSGDSFWVSPASDLAKLDPKDIHGSISVLLKDVLAHEKDRLKDLDETIKGYLEEKKDK
jgi:hypothetical protein